MQRLHIPPKALESLEKLSRFWSFSRKDLALKIRSDLQVFQEEVNAQHEQLISTQALAYKQEQDLVLLDAHDNDQQIRIAKLEEQLVSNQQHISQITQLVAEAQQKSSEYQLALDQAKETGVQLQARQVVALQRIGDLELQISKLDHEIDSNRQCIALLHETNEQSAASKEGLLEDLQQITNQHLTLRQKFELIQRILGQQTSSNGGLESFTQLIQVDYCRFAAQESSLADEAGALLELQAIHRELELIVEFPSVLGKTLLAIAGGFSSGKSQFINSFICKRDSGAKIELAVGMNPVTVVPSYVVCGEQPAIRGYSTTGGSFAVSEKLYASLSHEYVETFGFDLRRIMPFISVQASMQLKLFEHLCLIDTPGYNPGGGRTTSADHDVAQNFAGQASAMIWVIGLDPAGTISQSDLDFIEKTKLQGKSLYILLNKADTKSTSALEEILDEVESTLKGHRFKFAGICAYSSRKSTTFDSGKSRIYASRGQSLEDFLRRHNCRHDVIGKIEMKIDSVFNRYKDAIKFDGDRKSSMKKHLDRFKLKTLEIGGSDLYKEAGVLCKPIEKSFDTPSTRELSALANECEMLRKRFKEAVHATLSSVLAENSH